MSTQKSLVIAKPCHENWGKMSPTEQGRFCSSCTKEVVDFRDKKKEDIIQYLENYKGEGQTCGQFHPSQIDKVGKTYINSSIYKRIGISIMALLGVFSFKNANAQKPKMGKVAIKGDISYQDYNQNSLITDVKLYGSVRTLAGEKISGAEIKINADGKQLALTKTFVNGTFAVQFKVDKSMKSITIYTKAEGYETKITFIPEPQKEKIKVDIVMESEMMLLGEIAIEVDTVKTDSIKSCNNIIETDTTDKLIKQIEKDPINSDSIIPIETDKNDTSTLDHKIDLIDDKNWLRIYPNPTSENAIIEWKDSDENKVEIFDMNGKLIWSAQIKGNKTVFNTANLSNGNYLVKITSKLTGKSESTQLTVLH